jgi:hypothetical protein
MLRYNSDAPVLYSSRRRRYRQARRQSLPDWVWGAGLGVIALIIFGGYFLLTGAFGSETHPCREGQVPLGTSEISQEAFIEHDIAMGRVIDLLNAGDVTAAQASFYGPLHNFTHNIDPDVRERDPELAYQLCRTVLDVEEAMPRRVDPREIAFDMERVRQLLRDAAEILGYERPG